MAGFLTSATNSGMAGENELTEGMRDLAAQAITAQFAGDIEGANTARSALRLATALQPHLYTNALALAENAYRELQRQQLGKAQAEDQKELLAIMEQSTNHAPQEGRQE